MIHDIDFPFSFLTSKNNVKKQLKIYVKKHISFETDQKCYSSMLPSYKPKPKPSVNSDLVNFKFTILCFGFKVELNTATQEDEQQDSIDEKIKAVIKGFFAIEILNAETE